MVKEKVKKKQAPQLMTIQIAKIKSNIYTSLLKKIAHTKLGRGILIKKLKEKAHTAILEKNKSSLKKVNEKKYQFLLAMFESTKRNVDKGYISHFVVGRVIDTLIKYSFANKELTFDKKEKFKEKYGVLPPTFITFAPSQKCNLQCIGCYASSVANAPTLSFDIVDKVVDEVYNEWGNRFMTITGGEPFMYEDKGKTLFNIYKKYPNMFFLVYTNGTLITKQIARKLAELGNVTPAISLEGWEKETDERRGRGVYKRILESMENLRQAGVLFGVSITSTKKNINTLLDDKFYEFLFEEQGASYMWQFQLMPIGKGNQVKELMITPEQRVKLYKKWASLLEKKQYCIADFWNSGVLSDGCIAFGRHGGYLYIDWNGNIMPCVFVPYSQDNIKDLYRKGQKIANALFSPMFVNGRKWQEEYGLNNKKNPKNWLMPCSIRDHFYNFKHNIFQGKGEDETAEQAIHSEEYEKTLKNFDDELEQLTLPIWKKQYLEKG